jgi:hypothetical protein
MFGKGEHVLFEYDPTVADMDLVNREIDSLERKYGRAFSKVTGDAVDKVTPDTRDISIIRPLAGG